VRIQKLENKLENGNLDSYNPNLRFEFFPSRILKILSSSSILLISRGRRGHANSCAQTVGAHDLSSVMPPLAKHYTMPPAAPVTVGEVSAPCEAANGCGTAGGGGGGTDGVAVIAIDGSAAIVPLHGSSSGGRTSPGAAAEIAAEASTGSESTRERRITSLAQAPAAAADVNVAVVERRDDSQAPRAGDGGGGRQYSIRENIRRSAGAPAPVTERRRQQQQFGGGGGGDRSEATFQAAAALSYSREVSLNTYTALRAAGPGKWPGGRVE
jgi:hypothetical protein